MKFLEEQSCWIIIHFGTNPVKGGRPPRDSKLINIAAFKIGLEVTWFIRWLK